MPGDMTNDTEDIPMVGGGDAQKPLTSIDLSSLPSAQRVEIGLSIEVTKHILRNPLTIDTEDIHEDDEKVRFEEGRVVIDKKTLLQAEESMRARLLQAIEEGDNNFIERYLWYLNDNLSDEAETIRVSIRAALETRDTTKLKLDAVRVNLPDSGMAQRQLIKDALEEKIKLIPVKLEDASRTALLPNDVDYIYTQINNDAVLLIGGLTTPVESVIASVGNESSYALDLENIQKLPDNIIKIPLKNSANGNNPPVKYILVVQGKTNIASDLVRQEEEEERRPTSATQQSSAPTPSYRPSPPSVPTRPSTYSGGRSSPQRTTWVSSH